MGLLSAVQRCRVSFAALKVAYVVCCGCAAEKLRANLVFCDDLGIMACVGCLKNIKHKIGYSAFYWAVLRYRPCVVL